MNPLAKMPTPAILFSDSDPDSEVKTRALFGSRASQVQYGYAPKYLSIDDSKSIKPDYFRNRSVTTGDSRNVNPFGWGLPEQGSGARERK